MSDNELIAEFLGKRQKVANLFYFEAKIDEHHIWRLDQLKFNTSWDWLMPVVNKIAVCCGVKGYTDGLEIRDLRLLLVANDINKVYRSCIKYIKWYNIQKVEH